MTVTLLTDFGDKDEYVGAMKGVILKINPKVTLVDLSHEIPPGDVRKAGWLLTFSWAYFPKGTIHVIVVDPGVGTRRRILCLEWKGHRFLAPDNGVLTALLKGSRRPALYAVTQRRYFLKPVSSTFHGRDIFAPVAGYLSKGLPPNRLGARVSDFKRLDLPQVRWLSPPRYKRLRAQGKRLQDKRKRLQGQVIDIDRFGNALTNVSAKEMARRFPKWREIKTKVKGQTLSGILPSYASVPGDWPLGIIGSRGFLEISVNQGSASQRLRLKIGDPIEVFV